MLSLSHSHSQLLALNLTHYLSHTRGVPTARNSLSLSLSLALTRNYSLPRSHSLLHTRRSGRQDSEQASIPPPLPHKNTNVQGLSRLQAALEADTERLAAQAAAGDAALAAQAARLQRADEEMQAQMRLLDEMEERLISAAGAGRRPVAAGTLGLRPPADPILVR